MLALLAQLAGDYKHRDVRFGSANYCGALFPDLATPPSHKPIVARLQTQSKPVGDEGCDGDR